MLWKHYVFRRGRRVHDLWESLFDSRSARILYVAGSGFDVRAQTVLRAFVENLRESGRSVSSATLLLIEFTGYELAEDLRSETEENGKRLTATFAELGPAKHITFGVSANGDDDASATTRLRIGTEQVVSYIDDQTDILLDVSSMPRVVYVALLTNILHKLVADRGAQNPLSCGGVNFQVLVAEDAKLDAAIRSEDPSNDLVIVPGFSAALHAESVQDWPLVWFPILGENKLGQLQKVMEMAIPLSAEICPVLPHPSQDLRRAERLLLEYRHALIDARGTPTANILLAHESHPFEAYRQLLKAMRRYRNSMRLMGGCRLVVTPLGSKLTTLGICLACYEMRAVDLTTDYGVAIPYAEPTRYLVPVQALKASKPEICAMLLTGDAYEQSN